MDSYGYIKVWYNVNPKPHLQIKKKVKRVNISPIKPNWNGI